MKTPQPNSSGSLHPICSALRTFEVHVKDWPDSAGIYAATTPAKAKFQAWRGAHSAGYHTVTFGDLRVKRTPEFDKLAGELKRGGVNRDHARLLMQNA